MAIQHYTFDPFSTQDVLNEITNNPSLTWSWGLGREQYDWPGHL